MSKEKKSFDCARKGEWEFINTVIKHSYKPWACVIELFDNSVDAVRALPNKVKNRCIDINYSNKNDSPEFLIHDNGVGMTPKVMNEVLTKYISHLPTRKNGISTVGIGLSCAILGLSDMENATMITVESTTEDGTYSKAVLVVSKDKTLFEKFNMSVIEGDQTQKRGTTITIRGGIDLTQFSRQIKAYVEKIHPHTTSMINISINGAKIDFSDKDKLGLHNFNKPVEEIESGYYNINNRVYYIKDWTLVDALDSNVKHTVKALYSYQPMSSTVAREVKKTDGGAFAILGGSRLLVCGGNFGIKKWTGFPDRGGIGRALSCIVITDDLKTIFEISGNKVNGLTPFGENNNLTTTKKYYVLNSEGEPIPFFEAHKELERKFSDMYKFETDGKKDAESRKITDDIALGIINGASLQKFINEYDEKENMKVNDATSTNEFEEACKSTENEPSENKFKVTEYFTTKDDSIVEIKDYRNIVGEKIIESIRYAFSDFISDNEEFAFALDAFVKRMAE